MSKAAGGLREETPKLLYMFGEKSGYIAMKKIGMKKVDCSTLIGSCLKCPKKIFLKTLIIIFQMFLPAILGHFCFLLKYQKVGCSPFECQQNICLYALPAGNSFKLFPFHRTRVGNSFWLKFGHKAWCRLATFRRTSESPSSLLSVSFGKIMK